jgi:hypothetical protein
MPVTNTNLRLSFYRQFHFARQMCLQTPLYKDSTFVYLIRGAGQGHQAYDMRHIFSYAQIKQRY